MLNKADVLFAEGCVWFCVHVAGKPVLIVTADDNVHTNIISVSHFSIMWHLWNLSVIHYPKNTPLLFVIRHSTWTVCRTACRKCNCQLLLWVLFTRGFCIQSLSGLQLTNYSSLSSAKIITQGEAFFRETFLSYEAWQTHAVRLLSNLEWQNVSLSTA